MSFQSMLWATRQKLPAMQKIVLLMLSNRADDKGFCYPSHDLIADDCGMSRRAAINNLLILENIGAIKVSRGKKGSHVVHKYYLNFTFTSAYNAPVHMHEVHITGAGDAPVHMHEVHTKQSIETVNETVTLNTSIARARETKKDIVLSQEQSDCYQWAINHSYWQTKINDNAKEFLRLYGNQSERGVKNQYNDFQQAQKNPQGVNQAGFNQNQSSSNGANYDTKQRKLTIPESIEADRQRMLAKRERDRAAAQLQNSVVG